MITFHIYRDQIWVENSKCMKRKPKFSADETSRLNLTAVPDEGVTLGSVGPG